MTHGPWMGIKVSQRSPVFTSPSPSAKFFGEIQLSTATFDSSTPLTLHLDHFLAEKPYNLFNPILTVSRRLREFLEPTSLKTCATKMKFFFFTPALLLVTGAFARSVPFHNAGGSSSTGPAVATWQPNCDSQCHSLDTPVNSAAQDATCWFYTSPDCTGAPESPPNQGAALPSPAKSVKCFSGC
jgi:hypothetical protein